MNVCNTFNNLNETTNEDNEYNEQDFIKKNNHLFIQNYKSFKQYKHLYTSEKILNNICYINDNNLVIQHAFFKKFANKNNYDIIIQHIVNNINIILQDYELINVHCSLHKMDLIDLDKHYDFLLNTCKFMQSAYPTKLNKFYIYQPPFIYSKIYSIICNFIDKTTRARIKLIE
jgi:hypothetical protein